MKRACLLPPFILLYTIFPHFASPCTNPFLPTSTELRTLLEQTTPADAALFLNLLYYSYARSASTLKVQKAAQHALHELHTQWHRCTMRRFDPSKSPPDYSTIDAQINFAALRAEFHTIHSAYDAIVRATTEPTSFYNRALITHIATMRTHARSIVLNAVHTLVGEIQAQLKALLTNTQANLPYRSSPLMSADAPQLFITLVNCIAAHSFGELNETLLATSATLTSCLEQTAAYNNLLWHTIETARAQFYATYFNAVHTLLTELRFPTESFMQLDMRICPAPHEQLTCKLLERIDL